jgi:hypothetical protein
VFGGPALRILFSVVSEEPTHHTLLLWGARALDRQNKTKQNKTKQNKTKQNKTKQNKTKQNKTKQNKTKRADSTLLIPVPTSRLMEPPRATCCYFTATLPLPFAGRMKKLQAMAG